MAKIFFLIMMAMQLAGVMQSTQASAADFEPMPTCWPCENAR